MLEKFIQFCKDNNITDVDFCDDYIYLNEVSIGQEEVELKLTPEEEEN